MKIESIVKNTKTPVTKTDIVNALSELGLNKHSKIEVHASLSAFGFVVNKAYDIVDALMEVVSEGVIIMPAHTPEMTNPRDWSNPPVPEAWFEIIEKNRKPFDPRVFQPERIGEIAKVFMNYPLVERTLHPEVSLAVYNMTNDLSWLDHSFDVRDLIHPFYKLKIEGGQILMMGTDFFTCTSIHLSEFMCEFASLSSYDYKIKVNDEIIKKTIITKYFDDDDLNFKYISEKYISLYKDTEYYKQVQCGLATLTLIDASKLYDIAQEFHINYKRV